MKNLKRWKKVLAFFEGLCSVYGQSDSLLLCSGSNNLITSVEGISDILELFTAEFSHGHTHYYKTISVSKEGMLRSLITTCITFVAHFCVNLLFHTAASFLLLLQLLPSR